MAHIEVPHLQVPFRIAGPSALVVDQDTLEEIAQNVSVIVGTRVGQRVVVPTFGIADPTFSTELDTGEVAANVALWEERAQLTFVGGDPDPERDLTIQVGRAD